MKEYKINELFYSVQGEGARAGSANVFIRFALCDMTCGFCDTEFESYTLMDADEVAGACRDLLPEGVKTFSAILTGGEPLLQYDDNFRAALDAAGCVFVAAETNGGTKPKAKLDWVSCSPKVAEHVVLKNFPEGVGELRYVRAPGQGLPRPLVTAKHYFVSPMFSAEGKPMAQALADCVRMVKANPKWRLSTQQHKLWGVR